MHVGRLFSALNADSLGPIVTASTSGLSQDKSTLLHVIRWVAAFVVLLGHTQMYAMQRTKENVFPSVYVGGHAHAAVVVFFVLSGFVIAWCVDRDKERSWKKYYIDRFTRIYSVLPIALLFTMVVDYGGQLLSNAYYDARFIPQDHYILRFLVNLLSIQGFQGYRVQFGSNPALWSIGYEFFYYLVFGLLFFRKQFFRTHPFLSPLLALLLLALAGKKIALYFLLWLCGAAAYWLQRRVKLSRSYFWPALLLVVVCNHFVVYQQAFSSEFGNDMTLAFSLAFLLLPASPAIPYARVHNIFAGFSYSLYSFHMPVLFFLFFVIYAPGMSTIILAFSGIVASLLLSWGISFLLEKKRYVVRTWMVRRFVILQTNSPGVQGDNLHR